jgi:hypothetical protein
MLQPAAMCCKDPSTAHVSEAYLLLTQFLVTMFGRRTVFKLKPLCEWSF